MVESPRYTPRVHGHQREYAEEVRKAGLNLVFPGALCSLKIFSLVLTIQNQYLFV